MQNERTKRSAIAAPRWKNTNRPQTAFTTVGPEEGPEHPQHTKLLCQTILDNEDSVQNWATEAQNPPEQARKMYDFIVDLLLKGDIKAFHNANLYNISKFSQILTSLC